MEGKGQASVKTIVPKSVNQQQMQPSKTVTGYDLNYLGSILRDEMGRQESKVHNLQRRLESEKKKLEYMQDLEYRLHHLQS